MYEQKKKKKVSVEIEFTLAAAVSNALVFKSERLIHNYGIMGVTSSTMCDCCESNR